MVGPQNKHLYHFSTDSIVPLVFFVTISLFGLIGCGSPHTPYPQSLLSEKPAERASAAKYAAEIGDETVIPILIERLEDEDEVVRMFAILALERLTGTRRGYDYHAPEVQRIRAVQRWRRYLNEQASPSEGAVGGPKR